MQVILITFRFCKDSVAKVLILLISSLSTIASRLIILKWVIKKVV